MFKNRFLLVIGVAILLLVTVAVSQPSSVLQPAGANDFFQRHRDWNRNLEGSDYYTRHPELNVPAVVRADEMGDFALRHPEWTIDAGAAIPVTGSIPASDYFQRHPELRAPVLNSVDMSDFASRHPELSKPATVIDLSDYFQRR